MKKNEKVVEMSISRFVDVLEKLEKLDARYPIFDMDTYMIPGFLKALRTPSGKSQKFT